MLIGIRYGRTMGLMLGLLLLAAGCRAIPPKLANSVPGLTLSTVQQVQSDPTQTQADRLAIIRSLLGVADDAAGNRIATFILNLQVPPRQ